MIVKHRVDESLRPVEVSKEEYAPDKNRYVAKPDYKAWFHAWSTSAEPGDETGGYSWPMAIVEKEDGQIETVEARLIRFLDCGK